MDTNEIINQINKSLENVDGGEDEQVFAPPPQEVRPVQPLIRAQKAEKSKVPVGVFTAALTLITMGGALVYSMITGGELLLLAKLTPLILVYLGLEIIINIIAYRDVKVVFGLKSLSVAAGLVLLAFFVSLPIANSIYDRTAADNNTALLTAIIDSNKDSGSRLFVQESVAASVRNELQNSLAQTDMFSNIADVQVETTLYGTELEQYIQTARPTDTDDLSVTVVFRNPQATVRKFAEDAKDVITLIKTLNLPVETLTLYTDNYFDRITLTLNGFFEFDLTVEELMELSGYTGTNIALDSEIAEDIEETTDESGTTLPDEDIDAGLAEWE